MSGRTIRGVFLLALVALSIAGCERAPLAPTDQPGAASQPAALQSNRHGRPIKGECTTTISFLEPGTEGQCAVFLPVLASAFIRIEGECTVSHLGRTTVTAIQQLLFEFDQNGVPIVTSLRNCSTLTAANGDTLTHTTTGIVSAARPEDVSFTGPMTFTGGTGRFADASGSATFNGTASLATNTGAFSFEGTIAY